MPTPDRDVSTMPIPWYWILCLSIAGLSVVCGVIVCICLDRHMKKRLLAYLNEHEELHSVLSEDEYPTKKSASRSDSVVKEKNNNPVDKVDGPAKNVDHTHETQRSNATASVVKSKHHSPFKGKSEEIPTDKSNDIELCSYTHATGNYFQSDGHVEVMPRISASSVKDIESSKPVKRSAASDRPVKSLKKAGSGMASYNPNPMTVAAIAVTAFTNVQAIKTDSNDGSIIEEEDIENISNENNDKTTGDIVDEVDNAKTNDNAAFTDTDDRADGKNF